jgi:hypothetical protein
MTSSTSQGPMRSGIFRAVVLTRKPNRAQILWLKAVTSVLLLSPSRLKYIFVKLASLYLSHKTEIHLYLQALPVTIVDCLEKVERKWKRREQNKIQNEAHDGLKHSSSLEVTASKWKAKLQSFLPVHCFYD